MMSLNHILRKCTEDHKLIKSQETINQRMYLNDVKLFAENMIDPETDANIKNI